MDRLASKLFSTAIVLTVILAFGSIAYGQGLTAVTGRVTDPTGAVIPGVTVSVTNNATGAARTVVSNEQGIYSVTQLAPGTYNIKAELTGFKPKAANNVVLPVEQTITVNLPLEVGALTDTVDVTATAEVVNTENAALGNNFDTKKISELPLNARNIVGLLSLQTGVSLDTGDSSTSGYVNGARNDQQNIVLDGVDNNRQYTGSALSGALPTTLDSVQEFVVQTSGQSAAAGRSSGGQVQLVTKSGSNSFHGSAYESYRSKVTTATPYFQKNFTCTDAAPDRPTAKSCKPGLIRNIPGGSIGGPIMKNKIFFFGAYERRTDRSQSTVSRSIPTPTMMAGTVRYLRTSAAFQANGQQYGTITQGCGGMLEKITLIPCDAINPTMLSFIQKYNKYLTDPSLGSLTCPADCSNFQTFQFNAPNISNQNIYISRFDFNVNSKNTVYVRGTLNNLSDLGTPTFPDTPNALTDYNNSKGFAASWNSVLSPTMNNVFTAGLTRDSTSQTGVSAATSWGVGPAQLFQTRGANWRAINTWNFVDNLSWVKGTHALQFGTNMSMNLNYFKSYGTAGPGSFGAATNEYAGDTTGNTLVARAYALGTADPEYAAVSNKQSFVTALSQITGTFNKLTGVGIQFDTKGNLLPVGTAFLRNIRMNQMDFYIQDSWKFRSNLSFNLGLSWGFQTSPWERDGVEVNWLNNMKDVFNNQRSSTKTWDQLRPLTTSAAGRANGKPDYYKTSMRDFAPRLSFAYTPKWKDGFLGVLASKGGQLVMRGGYSLAYDHTGGRIGSDFAENSSIGLLTTYAMPIQTFTLDGVGQPRAPRISGSADSVVLPFNQMYSVYPISSVQNFIPQPSAGGWGGVRGLPAIDPDLKPPTNQLINFTLSKELPGGLVIEGSYVGRFARGLMNVLDLANPLNVIDSRSGIDYYTAQKMLFENYENKGFGSQNGALTTANVLNSLAGMQPIAWFENVYGDYRTWASAANNGTLGYPGVQFANATQAFYAVLNKSKIPGPNSPVVYTDATNNFETAMKYHITTNGQAQYLPLYSNVGWSNYNSGQLTIRKRFSKGFTVTGNYTLAHSLDTTSAGEALGNRPGGSGGADQLIDPYHPELNYGNSTFDRRHQFNGNFVAELPFGKGKLIGSGAGRILDGIIGGWSVSGIVTTASGSPFHYTAGSRFTLHYNGQDIAVPASDLEYGVSKGHAVATFGAAGSGPAAGLISGGGTPTVFFIKDSSLAATCVSDSACTDNSINRRAAVAKFVTPYYGGPIARNYVYGPGMINIDAGLTKNVKVHENLTASIRAEAFNVMNHVNFNNPGSLSIDSNSATSSSLGQITGARPNRVMQFTVRLQF